jgi:antitoxin ParD1/3/4
MSRNTMSFALPEELRAYVDERVSTGEYGNTSEYLRELIRRDRHDVAVQRLRELVIDGLESGEGRPLTDDLVAELRREALDSAG